jgi:hypothetical protein
MKLRDLSIWILTLGLAANAAAATTAITNVSLTVSTNGTLIAPTNFFGANAAKIAAAIGTSPGGAATNAESVAAGQSIQVITNGLKRTLSVTGSLTNNAATATLATNTPGGYPIASSNSVWLASNVVFLAQAGNLGTNATQFAGNAATATLATNTQSGANIDGALDQRLNIVGGSLSGPLAITKGLTGISNTWSDAYALVIDTSKVGTSDYRSRILQKSISGVANYNTIADTVGRLWDYGSGGGGTSPENCFFIGTNGYTQPFMLIPQSGGVILTNGTGAIVCKSVTAPTVTGSNATFSGTLTANGAGVTNVPGTNVDIRPGANVTFSTNGGAVTVAASLAGGAASLQDATNAGLGVVAGKAGPVTYVGRLDNLTNVSGYHALSTDQGQQQINNAVAPLAPTNNPILVGATNLGNLTLGPNTGSFVVLDGNNGGFSVHESNGDGADMMAGRFFASDSDGFSGNGGGLTDSMGFHYASTNAPNIRYPILNWGTNMGQFVIEKLDGPWLQWDQLGGGVVPTGSGRLQFDATRGFLFASSGSNNLVADTFTGSLLGNSRTASLSTNAPDGYMAASTNYVRSQIASIPPSTNKYRFYFFGDSLSAGAGNWPAFAVTNAFLGGVTTYWTNLAIGGTGINDALTNWLAFTNLVGTANMPVIGEQGWAVLWVGANDGGLLATPATYLASVSNFCFAASTNGLKTCVLGMHGMTDWSSYFPPGYYSPGQANYTNELAYMHLLRQANFYDMFIDTRRVLFDPYDSDVYDPYGLHVFGAVQKLGEFFAQSFKSGGTVEINDPPDPMYLASSSLTLINPTNKAVLVKVLTGQGNPQNAVAAPPGSFYLSQTGAAQSVFVKMAGTDALGWGEILANPATTYDTNTQDFISRAGSISAAEGYAVTNLVSALKAAGLWSKLDILYPFVGSSSNSTAQNLISSNHPVAWTSSGLVFDSKGVNGAGGWGTVDYLTHVLTGLSNYSLNSGSFGFFASTNLTQFYKVPMGAAGSVGNMDVTFDATSGGSPYLAVARLNDNTLVKVSYGGVDETGPLIASRTDAAHVYLRTRAGATNSASSSTATPDANGLGILCQVDNAGNTQSVSSASLRMAFVGGGLSTYECGVLAGIMEQFNASITNGTTAGTSAGYVTAAQVALQIAAQGASQISASNFPSAWTNTIQSAPLTGTNLHINAWNVDGTITNALNTTNATITGLGTSGTYIYGDRYRTNGTWIGSGGEVLSNNLGTVTIAGGNITASGTISGAAYFPDFSLAGYGTNLILTASNGPIQSYTVTNVFNITCVPYQTNRTETFRLNLYSTNAYAVSIYPAGIVSNSTAFYPSNISSVFIFDHVASPSNNVIWTYRLR